jgi:glycosyltransferase involved in cell wall biosynthesis
MHCPNLQELPEPPPGRTGWPWTEGSAALPPTMSNGDAWPCISIVTPSFNQARFLEATIRSILLQSYPNLEYFVLDGGSSDGSVDIIRKYEPWLTAWVSEPDGGQSNAINRGLKLASGTFATWINSDDMLHRHALATHASRIGFNPAVVYGGDCLYIDDGGRPLNQHRGLVHDLRDLVSVRTVWRSSRQRGHIVQPEVLFPRQLAIDVGGLDAANHRTMDYELWGRFLLAGATFQYTEILFAMFRLHGDQKTSEGWATTQSLVKTAVKLVDQARDLSELERRTIVADLYQYERDYWRETGPLARVGLPADIVLSLRGARDGLRRRAGRFVRRMSALTSRDSSAEQVERYAQTK